jgi:hypothetical protein
MLEIGASIDSVELFFFARLKYHHPYVNLWKEIQAHHILDGLLLRRQSCIR